MIIEVNGHQVEVDDSFAELSEEQQQIELQHIVSSLPKAEPAAKESTPFAVQYAPEVGALSGAGVGLTAGPSIAKNIVEPIVQTGAKKIPGQAVKNYIANSTDMPFAGGKDYGTAYEKAKIAAGQPIKSRGSQTPIRRGSLGITTQPEPPSFLRNAGTKMTSQPAGQAGRVGSGLRMGAAGSLGGKAVQNLNEGNYGEAALQGTGALAALAGQSRYKPLRLLGNVVTGSEIVGGVSPFFTPKKPVEEKAVGGLAGYAAGNVVKKAGVAAKKAASNLDLGKKIPESSFTASPEQTVSNPLRNAFPGIYKRPDVIAREASERVAPESPALKQLFGVTRDDLYQMGKGRTGNMPGMLPGAAANPKGSKAAMAVMNPRNEQRLLDVLGEAEKYPELVKGMDPWYIMDPAYKRLEELVGPEEAMKKYKQFNTMTGMASPGSDVLTEMNRGTAANFLATQGRFDEFLKYGGKGFNPDAPADIQNILGHPYHMTAQGKPMKQYLDTGEIQMSSPKVPMYIDASGVPQTGFQTDMPVGDAHWSRAVGLADTRGNATRKGKSVIPGASVSNPEMSQLGPWWRDKIASQSGLESVPAQARAWGAFSPQTGVESPIGAPKLELLSIKIMEAANRYGVSPEQARDMILKGEGYAGKAAGGHIDGYAKGKIVSAAKKFVLPPAENASRTQIIGTLPTYEKAGNILRQQGATGRGIDFGAGLGEGAKALGKDFDTYEPFAQNWKPTYSNAADVPSDEYGQLTNLNVLNVVPREVRDEIVQDIGRVMQPGGMGIITTRGKDVMNAKGLAGPEPMSVITSRDTYQKGFNKDELEEYLKYMLGDNFEIGRLNLGPAGAMIKKKAEGGLAYMKEGGKTPAWQRSEGKNPEGGLNAAGRASYNRETGGNLKAPQPEGGSRKKSFCARMSGMKKKLTSSETANDPDSRINKSLRKWKC
jgi:hypothetical protein